MGFFGLGGPPNPFGGGNPFSDPFGWPSGVPNPFGLPSPGQIGSTVGGWFTNPYGTTPGVQGPNPLNGWNVWSNPTQTNMGTTMPSSQTPYDAGALGGGYGNYGGVTPRGQSVNSTSLQPQAPSWGPPRIQERAAPTTQGMWTGGVGTGGPFGRVWEQQTGSGPWNTPQPGQAGYKAPGTNPLNYGMLPGVK